jgi:N-acetylneuraminate synthase
VNYGLKSSERANVQFRRSLYFVRDVNAGETISPDAVRSIRPGYGLAPKHLDEVVGARARTNLMAGTPVSSGQFERRN